ncbi:5'-3' EXORIBONUCLEASE [Salix koriyanagi]|uniref:5'-3' EXORIBONUCLEASE n=1 Tax=Salix koriyanagi TaxID=2511006 RepID=A0A9Q1A4I5_9ROSI|nr:5'-3' EXORIBONUCLEASE [Salix koriyanagi]
MQKEWEIRLQRQSKYQKPFHSSKSLFDDGVSESCNSSVKMGTTPLNQNQNNPQSMAIQQSNHFSFNDTSAVVDKIKLGDEGWKERFYAEKFETKSEDERDTIRRHAVHVLMLLFSILGVECAVLHMSILVSSLTALCKMQCFGFNKMTPTQNMRPQNTWPPI